MGARCFELELPEGPLSSQDRRPFRGASSGCRQWVSVPRLLVCIGETLRPLLAPQKPGLVWPLRSVRP